MSLLGSFWSSVHLAIFSFLIPGNHPWNYWKPCLSQSSHETYSLYNWINWNSCGSVIFRGCSVLMWSLQVYISFIYFPLIWYMIFYVASFSVLLCCIMCVLLSLFCISSCIFLGLARKFITLKFIFNPIVTNHCQWGMQGEYVLYPSYSSTTSVLHRV